MHRRKPLKTVVLEDKTEREIFMPGLLLLSSQKSWAESPSTVLFPLSRDMWLEHVCACKFSVWDEAPTVFKLQIPKPTH